MGLRTGHGNGRGRPHIEIVADELPAPLEAVDSDAVSGLERRLDGTVTPGQSAKELGRKGGKTRGKRIALARSLGIGTLASSAVFAPYRKAASVFRKHHCAVLASQAGGVCGIAPSSMVASAALQLAVSRYLFDLGATSGDVAVLKTASQMADASRQNLLAAYELAVREGQARVAPTPPAPAEVSAPASPPTPTDHPAIVELRLMQAEELSEVDPSAREDLIKTHEIQKLEVLEGIALSAVDPKDWSQICSIKDRFKAMRRG